MLYNISRKTNSAPSVVRRTGLVPSGFAQYSVLRIFCTCFESMMLSFKRVLLCSITSRCVRCSTFENPLMLSSFSSLS